MRPSTLGAVVLVGLVAAACTKRVPTSPSEQGTPPAGTTTKPPRAEAAQGPLRGLFQPELHWVNGEVSANGTGFLAKYKNGAVMGVTSAHFIVPAALGVKRIRFLTPATGDAKVDFVRTVGPPGDGGTDDPLDVRRDYVLLDPGTPPDGLHVFEMEDRVPAVGERVVFPNKESLYSDARPLAFGTVAEIAPEYVGVVLDQKLELVSQSGSPLLSEDGVVLGLLARGFEAEGQTVLIFTPISWVIAASLTAKDRPPLCAAFGERECK